MSMVASANGIGSPVTMPTPTYPALGIWVKTLAPAGSFRIEREYHSPPPAETNPYLTPSSQQRPSGNSPNDTYQSRPFHGSFDLDVLPPVGSGARSRSISHVRARYR